MCKKLKWKIKKNRESSQKLLKQLTTKHLIKFFIKIKILMLSFGGLCLHHTQVRWFGVAQFVLAVLKWGVTMVAHSLLVIILLLAIILAKDLVY